MLDVVVAIVVFVVEAGAARRQLARRGVDGDVAAPLAIEERDVLGLAARARVGERAEARRCGSRRGSRRAAAPATTARGSDRSARGRTTCRSPRRRSPSARRRSRASTGISVSAPLRRTDRGRSHGIEAHEDGRRRSCAGSPRRRTMRHLAALGFAAAARTPSRRARAARTRSALRA